MLVSETNLAKMHSSNSYKNYSTKLKTLIPKHMIMLKLTFDFLILEMLNTILVQNISHYIETSNNQ